MSKIRALAAVMLLGVALSACQKEEGPAEKAGKEIDKAVKETGQAMEKAVDSFKESTKQRSN